MRVFPTFNLLKCCHQSCLNLPNVPEIEPIEERKGQEKRWKEEKEREKESVCDERERLSSAT